MISKKEFINDLKEACCERIDSMPEQIGPAYAQLQAAKQQINQSIDLVIMPMVPAYMAKEDADDVKEQFMNKFIDSTLPFIGNTITIIGY